MKNIHHAGGRLISGPRSGVNLYEFSRGTSGLLRKFLNPFMFQVSRRRSAFRARLWILTLR
ncbi:hypothetical protein RD1_3194 [Roseobacter denitrificans OCh 114]|uniref:Uncharacterized protein n=1 Tax=Roseobacter denitrificans (strain ATCC 33942 / OCh 114) TaxID=375451 RepID=Q163Z4_ROSDO|nr:hypothetical protein RD1_3194 [Roseobacter denitrificans OCh 114]